jgi:alcohol dehydrogenase (cytochrome c)
LRKVITGIPGKTGIVYTLDRQTGEFLWATPTVMQTVITRIDGATGAVVMNAAMFFAKVGDERLVCPSGGGGKNWTAGAYSPLTNTMYYPLQNTCMTVTATEPDSAPLYAIRARGRLAPNSSNLGTIQAISVETGVITWKDEQRAGTTSLLATGGGLLFGGDANGRFRAYDQLTGEVLWEINLGSSVTGYPITYAVGGKQYVAVSTGASPLTGGLLSLTPELRPSSGNNIFVFTLPDRQ